MKSISAPITPLRFSNLLEESMSRDQVESRLSCAKRLGMKLFSVAALVLMVVMALPARAADARAVKSRVAPVYPEIAKRMRIGGEVKVEATVNALGKVTGAKAVSGNRMLTTAAEDAVRQWKFEPGSGESTVDVAVNFALAR
jgi:TonB family protein